MPFNDPGKGSLCLRMPFNALGKFKPSYAFSAPKSGFSKADCLDLVFKNVLPARAGSIFLQNGGKNHFKLRLHSNLHLRLH